MELLNDLGLDIATTGGLIAVVVLGALTVLLPMSAYAAQKWAYKTYLETKSVNEKLAKLLALAEAGSDTYRQPTPATGKATGRRREPTLGNADI